MRSLCKNIFLSVLSAPFSHTSVRRGRVASQPQILSSSLKTSRGLKDGAGGLSRHSTAVEPAPLRPSCRISSGLRKLGRTQEVGAHLCLMKTDPALPLRWGLL